LRWRSGRSTAGWRRYWRSSGLACRGRKGHRVDRAASLAPQQRGNHGKRPARVDHVIHEKHGTGGYLAGDFEHPVQIATTMVTVLLVFLRLVGAHLAHAVKERKAQRLRQAPGEIRYEPGMVQRRNAAQPFRCRIGAPSLEDHLRHRAYQPVIEV